MGQSSGKSERSSGGYNCYRGPQLQGPIANGAPKHERTLRRHELIRQEAPSRVCAVQILQGPRLDFE